MSYTEVGGTSGYTQMGGNAPYGAIPTAVPVMGTTIVSSSSIFPQGVGITDRDLQGKSPDDCSCPPLCWCWSRPMYFATADHRQVGKVSYCTPTPCKCCAGTAWEMDADMLGTQVKLEGRNCCGVDTFYEPEVHAYQGGRFIGKSKMLMPCFKCSETPMTEAQDASGKPRFHRIEHPCCPASRVTVESCCGWWNWKWPVVNAGDSAQAAPLTYIEARIQPFCMLCHPLWFGIRQFPAGLSADDQILLVTMAVTRWWRMEQQQQQNNNNGGGN